MAESPPLLGGGGARDLAPPLGSRDIAPLGSRDIAAPLGSRDIAPPLGSRDLPGDSLPQDLRTNNSESRKKASGILDFFSRHEFSNP